ncbi:MAG: DEAD/DEAH box helicase [Chlamydiota bacterium]
MLSFIKKIKNLFGAGKAPGRGESADYSPYQRDHVRRNMPLPETPRREEDDGPHPRGGRGRRGGQGREGQPRGQEGRRGEGRQKQAPQALREGQKQPSRPPRERRARGPQKPAPQPVQGRGRGGQAQPAAPKEPPRMPLLREVPPAEGKTRFTDLDIAKEVLGGVQDLQFEYCTPIQQQCLPQALAGRDVTGRAQTGTGKTAAFLASALTYMLRHPKENRTPGSCRVLVLAPTRELAIQIYKDAEVLGKYCGVNNLVVFGGMGYHEQRDALERPIDILVGTPGRIIDYTRSGHMRLGEAEILVIDEADRMLDMGFIPDVRRIVGKLPPAGERQTMLFSATLTPEIVRLVDKWLVDPVMIESEPEQLVTDLIYQKFFAVAAEEKLALLLWLLKHDNASRVLVFCNRRDACQRLARQLGRYRIEGGLLSGDVPQEKRLKILERFRAGATPVIVATDVAARGIHVDSVSHVVNYDMPYESDDYVHRIGRTGRAGETGKSIGFVCEYGAHMIPALEKLLGHPIACEYPTEEMVTLPPMPAQCAPETPREPAEQPGTPGTVQLGTGRPASGPAGEGAPTLGPDGNPRRRHRRRGGRRHSRGEAQGQGRGEIPNPKSQIPTEGHMPTEEAQHRQPGAGHEGAPSFTPSPVMPPAVTRPEPVQPAPVVPPPSPPPAPAAPEGSHEG